MGKFVGRVLKALLSLGAPEECLFGNGLMVKLDYLKVNSIKFTFARSEILGQMICKNLFLKFLEALLSSSGKVHFSNRETFEKRLCRIDLIALTPYFPCHVGLLLGALSSGNSSIQ
jgi:hypothetical protein